MSGGYARICPSVVWEALESTLNSTWGLKDEEHSFLEHLLRISGKSILFPCNPVLDPLP